MIIHELFMIFMNYLWTITNYSWKKLYAFTDAMLSTLRHQNYIHKNQSCSWLPPMQ